MSTAVSKVIPIPVSEASKRKAALDRDVEALIDVFRELHEIEIATGRSGLSARLRIAISGILTNADKVAQEARVTLRR